MRDTVESFHCGACQLSNLHKCPSGCVIEDMGTTFETSEHHYQFKKLKFHNKGAEAYDMLLQEDSFKAMKIAKEVLPDDKVSDAWIATTKEEMLQSNCIKYASCPHVQEKLLGSHLTLAEAIRDPYWGTGLNVTQTLECLSDYWPGQNIMGSVLMEVCDEIQKQQLSVTDEHQDEGKKQKAGSPLVSDSYKNQKV